jgi:hypothetical protein
MEKNQPTNAFREVHQKSLAVRKVMNKAKEHDTGVRENEAKVEAVREGFDRAATEGPTTVKNERTQ